MAWTNADYASRATVALQLEAARAFLGELQGAVSPGVGKDGAYRNSFDIVQLTKDVRADIRRLESKLMARSGGGMNRVVRGTPL